MRALPSRPNGTFGLRRDDIDEIERSARCRELRPLAHMLTLNSQLAALKAAETGDVAVLQSALTKSDRLPTCPRRRILATCAALCTPDPRRP